MKNVVFILTFTLLAGTCFADADYYWLQNKQPEILKVDDGLYKVTYFHPNGNIKETGYFKDGKVHGKWISYAENGTKTAMATFNSGKKVGKMRLWDENGEVISIVDFDNREIKDYRLNENTLVLHGQ